MEGGLQEFVEFDQKRGRLYQNLAHLVYCIEGLPDERRFATAAKVTAWINSPEPVPKHLERLAESTLREFLAIASDKKHSQAFEKIKQRVAPVEFIFIGTPFQIQMRGGVVDTLPRRIVMPITRSFTT